MSSFEYRLQRLTQGIVVLDAQRRVASVDRTATRMLEAQGATVILGADILDLHPPMVRAKVQWLLDSAAAQPDQPASMAMTLPMGTLSARVSAVDGLHGPGWCLVFHLVESMPQAPAEPLLKLPLDSRRGIRLLDVTAAAALRADGRYSQVFAEDGSRHSCTMGFAELSARLDPSVFQAVHRSWIVNLRRVKAVERLDGRWVMHLDAPGSAPVPISRGKVDEVRRRLAL